MFFFFKQKTAYEMRISDWSSDVCSSDLGKPSRARHADRVDAGVHIIALVFGRHHGIDHHLRNLIVRQPFAEAGTEREIGRASCRERVCKYRVDLGGRRIIKKKKTSTIRQEYNSHRNYVEN